MRAPHSSSGLDAPRRMLDPCSRFLFADIFPGGGSPLADAFAIAIAIGLFASATADGGDGLSGGDFVWLLHKAPTEVLILRPAPDDLRRLSVSTSTASQAARPMRRAPAASSIAPRAVRPIAVWLAKLWTRPGWRRRATRTPASRIASA